MYSVGKDLQRTVAAQYADDTTVYLNRYDLPKLRAAMEEYRLATGQRVNWNKSKIFTPTVRGCPTVASHAVHTRAVHRRYRHVAHGAASRGPGLHSLCPRCIGRAASDTYHLACGLGPLNIPLVIAANTVDRARKGSGLVHRAELWDRLAQGPSRILDNIAKASQLTMFGRAASTAAYAYQKSLYHGQMLQVDQGTLARWEQQATNVINGSRPRQQGPRTTFAACGHDTLVGTMKAGGFGLLPLRPHVRARQASFACDLIAHDTEWSQIYHAGPDQLGYFQFSPYHKLMLCCPPGARLWQDTEFPNLTFALDALHSAEARVTVLPNASSLEPGEGCAGIPFWHNPPL